MDPDKLERAAQALGVKSPAELAVEQGQRVERRVAQQLPAEAVPVLGKLKFTRNPRDDWRRAAPEFFKAGMMLAAEGKDPPSKWTADIMKLAITSIIGGKVEEISDEEEVERLAKKVFALARKKGASMDLRAIRKDINEFREVTDE